MANPSPKYAGDKAQVYTNDGITGDNKGAPATGANNDVAVPVWDNTKTRTAIVQTKVMYTDGTSAVDPTYTAANYSSVTKGGIPTPNLNP